MKPLNLLHKTKENSLLHISLKGQKGNRIDSMVLLIFERHNLLNIKFEITTFSSLLLVKNVYTKTCHIIVN